MTPDFFTPQPFNLITMTAAINKMPFVPGFLAKLGLFEEQGVATNTVFLEQVQQTVRILSTQPRDAPRQTETRERRQAISLAIPHIPDNDYIRASEIVGVRQFGSQDQLQTLEYVRNLRLAKMGRNLDLTLEYHRWGAIKGVVYDADGTSVVLNVPTAMGIAQPSLVHMDLEAASPASGVLAKTIKNSILRPLQKALQGLEPTGFIGLCGDNFYDDLVAHSEVRDTYKYQQGAMLRDQGIYESFSYSKVTWINVRTDGLLNGASNPALVESDYAYVIPTGVPEMFLTRFGPPNYFEAIGTVGLPRYAKAVADDWNKFIELEAQSNPLNVCTRPNAVFKLYKLASGG